MAQINIHTTPTFERNLEEYMRVRGISTKSEAIRRAVEEGLALAKSVEKPKSYHELIGLGLSTKPNPKPKFRSEDALWE